MIDNAEVYLNQSWSGDGIVIQKKGLEKGKLRDRKYEYGK